MFQKMPINSVINLFFLVYPLSLYLTGHTRIGFDVNNGSPIGVLNACVLLVCFVFYYSNKRLYTKAEKTRIIFSLIGIDAALKTVMVLALWYKTGGQDITGFVLLGALLTFIADAVAIVIAVYLSQWLYRRIVKDTTQGSLKTNHKGRGTEMRTSEEHLLAAIQLKKKEDPLIGLKIGAKEVNDRLIQALKGNKGVHVESLLTVLGSLAGFACQTAARDEVSSAGNAAETGSLMLVDGADGKKYFFGNAINKPLAVDKYSVWALTAGTAAHLGAKELPDLNEMFTRVSKTIGTSEFGVPELPEGHGAGDLPLNYLKVIWPSLVAVVDKFCDRIAERPILFGLAIQNIIEMGKDSIAPDLAAKVVMESAIPMSKVDPRALVA